MQSLTVNTKLLEDFEHYLNPLRPEKNIIPANIIGYGEISAVLQFHAEDQNHLVYKRMPLFENQKEADDYKKLFDEYNAILIEKTKLNLPAFSATFVTGKNGKPVLYIAQQKLQKESIGNQMIHLVPEEQIFILVGLVLRELKKVFVFNAASQSLRAGIDGQISNWSVADFDASHPQITEQTWLFYLDTSTPLVQKDGKEQQNPEFFLRSAPSFLVWVIRLFFLEEVMTRYYDFRRVAVDIIANFYKEQKPELVPALVLEVNRFFKEETPEFHIKEITENEVKAYYKQDKIIWRVFLALRRIDRFLQAKIFRKYYPYILPGKIKR